MGEAGGVPLACARGLGCGDARRTESKVACVRCGWLGVIKKWPRASCPRNGAAKPPDPERIQVSTGKMPVATFRLITAVSTGKMPVATLGLITAVSTGKMPVATLGPTAMLSVGRMPVATWR